MSGDSGDGLKLIKPKIFAVNLLQAKDETEDVSYIFPLKKVHCCHLL